jgi:hypothetical protein
MKKINYKAVFIYEEFTGLNIIKIIELLKYDSEQIESISLRQKDIPLWEIAIVLKKQTNIIIPACDILLKQNDYIAFDNGIYKKVDKHYIAKIITEGGELEEY